MVAANKNEKQIMDVTKPGKSAPSATAKPIIVGHGPMVQDPMVTSDTSAEAVAPAAEEIEAPVVVASPSASKKIISPISEEKAEPTEVPEVIVDTTTDNTDESVSASEESAVVDTIIDQVGSKAPATSDEDKKKHEHIEKLIAEKKYFVPLGKVNGKSGHGMLLFTLILCAVFLAFLGALDAEIIDLGFDLPFDLIKS